MIHSVFFGSKLKAFSPIQWPTQQAQNSDIPALFTDQAVSTTRAWRVGENTLSDEELRTAPATSLPIRLAGILSHQGCKHSIAIIENAKQQASYGCETITALGNVQILRIFPDKIVLNNKGYYETLALIELNNE